ncbi:MAG: 2-oxoacid:acceptor oxidoreductase subunit alpha [Myxococcota bacterium]
MATASPQKVERVVIRFAGDSGDGMQLVGGQFTRSSAMFGNDVATLPDYPAEIRAPAGTREGVSGFQIQFAGFDIHTPGDEVDVLVAMNPAALAKNMIALKRGGILVVNTDKFKEQDLQKARLDTNPLEDGSLSEFRVVAAPIITLVREAVSPFGLNTKEADRCKNFFALGMMYWLYTRKPDVTIEYIEKKFRTPYKEANRAALEAGYAFANTVELWHEPFEVPSANFPEGEYRNITGNAALAIGLATAASKTGLKVFYGSYPITPASDILHSLAPFKNYGVVTFQAEDEIAAVCAAIGASYGGNLGVTGTSGPGIALKSEAIGLAVMTELPLIIIDVQRGGPSTGLPTKTEQSDLLQNLYGRNGEAPCVVLCARSPSDCFEVAIEAARISTQSMVPVVLLSDGYIANGAEPWPLPDLEAIPEMTVQFRTDPEGYEPYMRDPETLARPWVRPGTPDLQHRIGGLEKQDGTGNVSYDPDNHMRMTELRAEKVRRVARTLPPTPVEGDDGGLLVLGWGSTYGSIRMAVEQCRNQGLKVGHAHLRYLNPLPNDLGAILARYDKVVVPEMNMGQLLKVIRAEYLVDAVGINKVKGLPFLTRELVEGIQFHAAKES